MSTTSYLYEQCDHSALQEEDCAACGRGGATIGVGVLGDVPVWAHPHCIDTLRHRIRCARDYREERQDAPPEPHERRDGRSRTSAVNGLSGGRPPVRRQAKAWIGQFVRDALSKERELSPQLSEEVRKVCEALMEDRRV